MCGIAGVINKTGRLSTDALREAVGRMNDALAHRGPDDAGIWISPDGHAALGHRRLSVIDLSPAGHQPMLHANGRDALVFNGEIYNYRAIRDELARAGAQFRSSSDSEVLLEALSRSGERALDQLDGMYAFAYYDSSARSLLLARDPFGEKPLYYYDCEDYLVFASELSGILKSGLFTGQVEAPEVAAYLFFRYVPQPHTIFRDIRKLEPGTWLRLRGNERRTGEYFRFTLPEDLTDLPLDEVVSRVEDEITASVESRLVSDVPLGAFLSSGVDSSLVCAIATQKLGIPLNTYTIGFEGEESEHPEADRIAALLGTRHHCRMISGQDLLETAFSLGRRMDEPNGDRSCVPTHILSRYAREEVTVTLSGDGGDELFCGYGRYFALEEAMARNPGIDYALLYFTWLLPVMPLDQLQYLFGTVPERFLEIYAAAVRHGQGPQHVINRLRALDAGSYLPGAVLAKVDRMSMAHSLEVRAPLLGRKVADLAGRIPLAMHLHDGRGKYILRQILKKYLPAELVDRKKTGFGMPGSFFKANKKLFKARLDQLTRSDAALSGVLDVKRLSNLLPLAGRNVQWACIVLDDWLAVLSGRPEQASSYETLLLDAEDAADTGNDALVKTLLQKPLPRRVDGPADDIRELAAAFDEAGLPPAWVNVFTYHVAADETYQPIMNIDLLQAFDHRSFDYDYILAYFSHAAKATLGNCNTILVTDLVSPLPHHHSFDRVIRLPLDKQATMYERVRAMAAYVNSGAFNADTLFLDSDAFIGKNISGVFNADFDIALTFREHTKMVLNEGVQFASIRRKDAVRRFYNGYLACYRALGEDPDVQAEYPQGIRKWRGGQLSLNIAGWDGNFPRHAQTAEIDGVRILYLDCDEYNYKPLVSDTWQLLALKNIAHFKGGAKGIRQIRAYALTKGLPGWALKDARISGILSDDGFNIGALSKNVTSLLHEGHYAVASSLCTALLDVPDFPPLIRGILRYFLAAALMRQNAPAESVRRQLVEARLLGPLVPAVDKEIDRMLGKLAQTEKSSPPSSTS